MIMVTVWWSAIGIVHYSFLESNKRIAAEIYWQKLDEIYIKLSKVCLALVNQQGPILLHDNPQPLLPGYR